MAYDEQVGNGSFQTMTPGSAVAGQLQNILTQKRLEARQAMLDEIAAKNTQSEIDYRAENAKSLAEDRASKAELRKAQQLQRMGSTLSPHMAISPESENYGILKENNLLDPGEAATAPLGPGEQGPSRPASPETFHGLPAQLKDERQQKLQEELFKRMSNVNEWDPMPDAQKEALFQQALGRSVPESVLRPKVGGNVIVYDPETDSLTNRATGKPAGTKGPNDTIVTRSRPPRPPVDHGTFVDRPVIIDGKIDPTKAWIMKNGKMTMQDLSSFGGLGPKQTAGGNKAIITPAEAAKYADLRGKATDQPGAWGGLLPTQEAKSSAKAAFAQLENDIYGRFPPELSSTVQAVMASEDPSTPSEAIVKHAIESGAVLPEEQQMFYHLLKTVRGR